jgi:hypothetical protein
MIFEEAVKYLRQGLMIRYESFEFHRKSLATEELAIKGSLIHANNLRHKFFSAGWEVEMNPGVWIK